MPLYFTWECLKCKINGKQNLWAISNNHKYSDEKYFCPHFNIIIDTVSNIGFLGFGWSNQITIKTIYKPNNSIKILINKTFNVEYTEHQNYALFGDVVIHGRISDYPGYYPTIGNNIQEVIDYNKKLEQQRKEKK